MKIYALKLYPKMNKLMEMRDGEVDVHLYPWVACITLPFFLVEA
jgi:hypothetical protein